MENEIFRALADPTRRAIFEKLAVRSMNATDLRAGLEISQPAVSQHIAALRGAGLVRETKNGRFTDYSVDPRGIAALGNWFSKYRAFWPERIGDLRALLGEMDQ